MHRRNVAVRTNDEIRRLAENVSAASIAEVCIFDEVETFEQFKIRVHLSAEANCCIRAGDDRRLDAEQVVLVPANQARGFEVHGFVAHLAIKGSLEYDVGKKVR